jgi:hypothetical protein
MPKVIDTWYIEEDANVAIRGNSIIVAVMANDAIVPAATVERSIRIGNGPT